MRLVVNGADVEVDDRHAKTPLLWVLRGILRVIEHPDPRTEPVFANLVRDPMAADPAAAPAAALAFSASPRTANAAKRRSPGSITVQRSHDLTITQVDNTGAFDDQRND
jgi:hypothetical protein